MNIVDKYKLANNSKSIWTNQAARNQKDAGKGLMIEKSSKVNVRKKMANYCGISEDSYRKLDYVMKSGNEILIEKLRSGELKINQAFNIEKAKIIVSKSRDILGYLEYKFSYKVADKIYEIGKDNMFIMNLLIDDVPDYLRKKFLTVYEKCRIEYWNDFYQKKNDTSSSANSNSFAVHNDSEKIEAWKIFYKDLVKIYHPDNSGDSEKMQKLTWFNSEIKNML